MAKTKKVFLVTDAWTPQINGVVTTYKNVIKILKKEGFEFYVLHPKMFKTFPLPFYPEIQVAYNHFFKIGKLINEFKPDYIHIATEGSLGLSVRKYCNKKKIPYTTAYHTKFPEYIKSRNIPVPLFVSYKFLRDAHKKSKSVLVPTMSVKKELKQKKFNNLKVWSRGYDSTIFNSSRKIDLGFEKPVFLYVGRVAVEKNIEEFLKLKLPGTKVVVGDGPSKLVLEKKYPDVVFVGYKKGVELAKYYASCDVFVFPSLTDTLGVVMIEAIACGTPVAAFNVTGPRDIITNGVNGFKGSDLQKCALKCMKLSRKKSANSASKWSWENTAKIFKNTLERI